MDGGGEIQRRRRGIYYGGYYRYRRRSLVLGKPRKKRKRTALIKFPIFSKNFEEINKVSANERIEANSEGMIFCGGGLYALWERGDKLLGWTAERTADTIPLKKTLKKKDFIDKYKENGRIALFEKIFKEIAVQQINL